MTTRLKQTTDLVKIQSSLDLPCHVSSSLDEAILVIHRVLWLVVVKRRVEVNLTPLVELLPAFGDIWDVLQDGFGVFSKLADKCELKVNEVVNLFLGSYNACAFAIHLLWSVPPPTKQTICFYCLCLAVRVP